VHVDHVAIVDFLGFENFINAIGGVDVNVPERVCSEISGGNSNGGVTLNLSKGDHTLNGREAPAYARTRINTCDPAYDDVNRGAAQQGVINGIKGRLTDPLRLPYNFIMGPIIGWDAPQAFVSDMGFFTMPQLVLSAAIGGSSGSNVLRPAGVNSFGALIITQSERRRAVRQLLGG
jgi:LytR_cpsA_psr family